MPFDNELDMFDGTVDPMVTAAPTSTTVSGGHKVLDLKETGAKGLVVVLVCTEAFDNDDSYINVAVQESDTEATGYATIGIIPAMVGANALGSQKNAPNVAMVRFMSDKRYIRASVDVGSGDDVGVCYILLASAPFITL